MFTCHWCFKKDFLNYNHRFCINCFPTRWSFGSYPLFKIKYFKWLPAIITLSGKFVSEQVFFYSYPKASICFFLWNLFRKGSVFFSLDLISTSWSKYVFALFLTMATAINSPKYVEVPLRHVLQWIICYRPNAAVFHNGNKLRII